MSIVISLNAYKWFYDNIHSHYYNLLIKWCFLPFGGEKKCRDELISHINFSKSEKILDMCCGTGGATSAIVRRLNNKSQIIGIDLSIGQLKIAAKREDLRNVKLMECDVTSTALSDNIFDKVFVTHALHEMQRDSRLKVLKEAQRVLKESGSIIILELDKPKSWKLQFFSGLWFFYWLPFNFETPTRKDMLRYGLANEVKECGFKDVIKTIRYKGIFQIVQGIKDS